jgi:ubiquinone/menaquinone biosynthesis C-methylase UbiE
MGVTAANFDRVAGVYRWLELAAFGRALERARFVHLDRLAGSHDNMLLGDGDGRALERIVAVAPSSRVLSIDASRRMLDLSRQRIGATDRRRVTWHHGDARTMSFPPASCDAVVTQFFLDCFTADETAALVRRIAAAVRPGGLWLFADFALPEERLPRLLARAVTTGLYWFFRWRTGISGRTLPPAEHEIRSAGFTPIAESSFAGGLLRSVAFRKDRVEARVDR